MAAMARKPSKTSLLKPGTDDVLGDGVERRPGVNRDPGRLDTAFAARLRKVFAELQADGHKPMLWEGWRSEERAQELAKRGTGVEKTLHMLGAAADVVDADSLWDASPDFWEALAAAAERNGLVSGGRWKKKDKPHVQAIPVKLQPELFAADDPSAFISRALERA